MPLVNHYPYPNPYPCYLGRVWITRICMGMGRILEGNYPFIRAPVQNNKLLPQNRCHRIKLPRTGFFPKWNHQFGTRHIIRSLPWDRSLAGHCAASPRLAPATMSLPSAHLGFAHAGHCDPSPPLAPAPSAAAARRGQAPSIRGGVELRVSSPMSRGRAQARNGQPSGEPGACPCCLSVPCRRPRTGSSASATSFVVRSALSRQRRLLGGRALALLLHYD